MVLANTDAEFRSLTLFLTVLFKVLDFGLLLTRMHRKLHLCIFTYTSSALIQNIFAGHWTKNNNFLNQRSVNFLEHMQVKKAHQKKALGKYAKNSMCNAFDIAENIKLTFKPRRKIFTTKFYNPSRYNGPKQNSAYLNLV